MAASTWQRVRRWRDEKLLSLVRLPSCVKWLIYYWVPVYCVGHNHPLSRRLHMYVHYVYTCTCSIPPVYCVWMCYVYMYMYISTCIFAYACMYIHVYVGNNYQLTVHVPVCMYVCMGLRKVYIPLICANLFIDCIHVCIFTVETRILLACIHVLQ